MHEDEFLEEIEAAADDAAGCPEPDVRGAVRHLVHGFRIQVEAMREMTRRIRVLEAAQGLEPGELPDGTTQEIRDAEES